MTIQFFSWLKVSEIFWVVKQVEGFDKRIYGADVSGKLDFINYRVVHNKMNYNGNYQGTSVIVIIKMNSWLWPFYRWEELQKPNGYDYGKSFGVNLILSNDFVLHLSRTQPPFTDDYDDCVMLQFFHK